MRQKLIMLGVKLLFVLHVAVQPKNVKFNSVCTCSSTAVIKWKNGFNYLPKLHFQFLQKT